MVISPVVSLSTDINRKGLCIAQKGGIVLDLRRMNWILEIDLELVDEVCED
jgi:FAD/FMN-containing dehydrogenase